MMNVKVRAIVFILVILLCTYAVLRDSIVLNQVVKYEFVDYDVNDYDMDSRVRLARAIQSTVLGTEPKRLVYCSHMNPCGWELYDTPGRKIYGFILNPCICPPKTQCVKDDDDLSTFSFVYRCHKNVSADVKVAPTRDIDVGGNHERYPGYKKD